MKNEKYVALLTEVFGKDYAQLIIKEKQDKQACERRAKIMIIEDIMKSRTLIGLPPTVKLFDYLYDLSLKELHLASVIWTDELYLHKTKTKRK